MGKREHLPPWKYFVFCALVVTAKRSADESFMHYFHNLSSAPPDPHRGSIPGLRWGIFVSQTPNLPTPGKNPVGAHGGGGKRRKMARKGTERVREKHALPK